MNQFNEDLKSALLGSLPEEARLSDLEKQKIRARIKELDLAKRRERFDRLPKALTALFAAVLLLVTGALIGTNLGFLNTGNPSPQKSLPFYEGYKPGDSLNGWKLISKGPSKAEPDLLEAVFDGRAVLTGTLVNNLKENGEGLYFIPDNESKPLLPLNHGKLDSLTFNQSDSRLIAKMYGVAEGGRAEGSKLYITSYKALQGTGREVPDIIKFSGTMVPEMESEPTKTDRAVKLKPGGIIDLDETLLQAYNNFARTLDENELKGLDPFSVFLLFFHAEELKDYQTQYAMYDHSPGIDKPFISLEEYTNESTKGINQTGRNLTMQAIRNSSELREIIIGGNSAVIYISKEEGLGFSLTKNGNGIWKVNWMPVQ